MADIEFEASDHQVAPSTHISVQDIEQLLESAEDDSPSTHITIDHMDQVVIEE